MKTPSTIRISTIKSNTNRPKDAIRTIDSVTVIGDDSSSETCKDRHTCFWDSRL
ncbi:hypothetical protein Hanom_Chr13g01196611 [Helianthus anomalus]